MIARPITSVIVASLVAISSSAARSAPALPMHVVVTNRVSLGDPGPPPPADDERTLAPFRSDGDSTIRIHPRLEFVDNDDPHRPGHECDGKTLVLLYPQTPYTLYMLKTWAKKIDGEAFSHDNALPGLPAAGTPNVPSLLNPRNKKGVVRESVCDRDGWATFHVPSGLYYAVTDMMFIDSFKPFTNGYYTSEPVYSYINDDFSDTLSTYHEYHGAWSHIGDGWGVVAVGAKVGTHDSVETSPTSGSMVVAHFSANINIPSELPSRVP